MSEPGTDTAVVEQDDDFEVASSTAAIPAKQPAPAAAPEKADEPAKAETEDQKQAREASEAGSRLAKRRQSIQDEINVLVRTRGDHEREIRALEARKAAIQREIDGGKPAGEKSGGDKPSGPDWQKYKNLPGAPKEEDFETYGDFVFAVNDFITDQKLAARDDASRRDQAARANQERFAKHDERIEATRAQHADYDAVMESAKDIFVPPHVIDYFLESEHGAELAYYLAGHHDEARSIAALTPLKAIAALGKLEDKLNPESSRSETVTTGPVEAPVVTKARPPIKPVGGGAASVDGGPPGDDADLDTHAAYWDRKDREAARPKR